MKTKPTDDELGRIAYNAYCGTRDWKSFRGDPLPQWEDSPEDVRKGWRTAAAAVRDARAPESFQDRVRLEKDELDGKIEKLEAFVIGPRFDFLPKKEKDRLIYQCGAMRRYSKVLGERIAAFEPEVIRE